MRLEPKIFCMLFLASLYSLVNLGIGFVELIALVSKFTGIIIGIALIGGGGWFAYLFFTKTEDKDVRYLNAIVGCTAIIGGITTIIAAFNPFFEDVWPARFFIILFIGSGFQAILAYYYYIPIQKFANGAVPVLGLSDVSQVHLFLVSSLGSIFIQAFAVCPDYPEAKYGHFVLRIFLAAIGAFLVGAATGYYLYKRSENNGYETQMDQGAPLNPQETIVDVETPAAN